VIEKYKTDKSEPVKHEQRYGDRVEVYYTCSKCMAVMVEMRCVHCSKKIKTQAEEDAMSEQMDALVREYNDITGRNIKRFASIGIGEQRLAAAKFKRDNPTAPPPPKPTVKKPRRKKDEQKSDAVRQSWDDPKVAAQRGKRHCAVVEGHGTYKSVWWAFDALGLPKGKVIGFRKGLKDTFKATFEHEGKAYHFTLAPRAKKATTDESDTN